MKHGNRPDEKEIGAGGRQIRYAAGVKELSVVWAAVLPVGAIMVAGYGLRRVRWLTAGADESLLRLCVNLLLPALIFESVVGNAALHRRENLIWPPVVAVAVVLLGLGVAAGVARLACPGTAAARRTFTLTTGLQNYGYIPLPLCQMLFDPGTLGVLFVHNVAVELTLWTVGIRILSGGTGRVAWRQIFSPPVVALLVGLVINFLPTDAVPGVLLAGGRTVMTAIHWLGQCAIPLALLMIGAIVADHIGDFQGGQMVRVVTVAAVVRLLILPALILLLVRWLPVSPELKRVMVLQAAMSSAVLPVALSKHYGGDPQTALQVVLGTSVLGLVMIPLWIRLGGSFMGLW